MTLEALVREQRPRKDPPLSVVVVWSGSLERAGQCPSLLSWTSGQSYYGASQLAHMSSRGLSGLPLRTTGA